VVKAAKKRKKEEDEAFAIPEFDERAYMTKEIAAAKLSFLIIALAVPVALALYGITVVGVPIVAFFLGLAVTFSLPRVVRLVPWPKVDTSALERRDWIGHGGTFLFSWLAFWILFLNVPFVDVTAPVISDVRVNGVAVDPGVQSPQVPPGTVWVNFTIFENGELRDYGFTVLGTDVAVQALGNSRYSAQVSLPPSVSRRVVITAGDGAGHVTTFEFDLATGS
jgi:hypothetical protein